MNPFIGQIMLFGGNFAPRGWAFCKGQLLPIAQYTALFSILGTTYGGDGRTTFALPDLQGRVAMSSGHGPGLSTRPLGQKTGTQTNTLTILNLPQHNHTCTVSTSTEAGTETIPGYLGATPIYSEDKNTNYGGVTVSNTGNNQAVNNIAPVLALNYIIALEGTFPSRS